MTRCARKQIPISCVFVPGVNVLSVEFRKCSFAMLDVKSCGTVLSTPHI